MSKLTSAIDAKSLVIGVLLTVVFFMSMGANPYRDKSYYISSVSLKKWDSRGMHNPHATVDHAVPFAVADGRVYCYSVGNIQPDPLDGLF